MPFLLQFSGLIEAVGDGVDAANVGRKVMGVTRFGAYASQIHADIKYLRDVPDGWSFAEAAAFPVQVPYIYLHSNYNLH